MVKNENEMTQNPAISRFDNCPPLDGYHCQTNSLARIFHYHNHPLSEDMLLGLGAGMGFIYWKMKMGSSAYVFIGGRGNNKGFFDDVGKRTGVKIDLITTNSARKAEFSLLEKLQKKIPVMLFGDMGLLPWFDFPQEYHFGGHTFVVCGYDGRDTLLASDMDAGSSGLKKGFFHEITLEQLRKARSSPYKPFPPKNAYLEFDFTKYRQPASADIIAAIEQTVNAQLNPPIKNLGIKGIRHAANEIMKWPGIFDDRELRMNLFNLYIFIEIGGTGGGCFRPMYARFLEEAATITGIRGLLACSKKMHRAGEMFSRIGLLFKDAERISDINERLAEASGLFNDIADIEESAYRQMSV